MIKFKILPRLLLYLHQPSCFYEVSSRELSNGTVDDIGLNKGLAELASDIAILMRLKATTPKAAANISKLMFEVIKITAEYQAQGMIAIHTA